MADGKETKFVPPAIIDYTNHRGERSIRVISPVRIYYGATPWHPDEQYLLEAWDLEKSNQRTFACRYIHAWKTPKEATIDASLAKQLQASIERNSRMMARLKKLLDKMCSNRSNFENEATGRIMDTIAAIFRDDEPTW